MYLPMHNVYTTYIVHVLCINYLELFIYFCFLKHEKSDLSHIRG